MGLESNSDEVNEGQEIQETNENAADEDAEKEAQDQEHGEALDEQNEMQQEGDDSEESSEVSEDEDDEDSVEDAGNNLEENPEDEGEEASEEEGGESPEENPEEDGEENLEEENPEDENPEDEEDSEDDDADARGQKLDDQDHLDEDFGDVEEDSEENPEDEEENPEDEENPKDEEENSEDEDVDENPEDEKENPEEDEENPEKESENSEDESENPEDEEETPESEEENPEEAEENRKNDLDANTTMSPALQEMSDYMAGHNYGRGDYPTYSQDPEWQRLNDNLKQEDADGRGEKTDDEEHPEKNEDEHSAEGANNPEKNIEDSSYRTVDANDIDMSDARGMVDPNFWNHHGNEKADYEKLAEPLSDIQKELDNGKTLDELKENPDYKDTINAYYNPDNMVKVEQKPDGTYEFQDDGRHRVKAAQDAGAKIPVEVVNAGEYQDAAAKTSAGLNETDGKQVPENGERKTDSGDAPEKAESKSEEADPSKGLSVKEIENSDGSKKSMDEIGDRFEKLNEKYENADSSTKEGKEELGKLYGQNMGAIKETREKYNTEKEKQTDLMKEMSDIHLQYDNKFPSDVQQKYDGLVKEYRSSEADADKLKYQEAKLESNNVHIADSLDKKYVPTSDMNSGGSRQQKMEGLQLSLDELEANAAKGSIKESVQNGKSPEYSMEYGGKLGHASGEISGKPSEMEFKVRGDVKPWGREKTQLKENEEAAKSSK